MRPAGEGACRAPAPALGPGGLVAVAAGPGCPAALRTGLAGARRTGRSGIDRRAGAGGHRLRRGLRCAGHLRPVRHHGRAAGLCAVRPEPHPGAGARLVAGCTHPGRRAATVRGRPATGCRAGRHDGPGVGCAVRRRRRRAAGLRHRIAVQADPLRLHERHRADGDRQPVAGAVRLRRRCPRTARRVVAIRAGLAGRQHESGGTGHRRRQLADHPLAQAPSAAARGAGRRGGGDPGRQRPGPGLDHRRPRRSAGARRLAAGPAWFLAAFNGRQRHRTGAARWAGGGTDLVRRHQRPVADLRGPNRHFRRSEPGDGRPGRSQPGRRAVPGLSDQRQRLTHTGGRGSRRQDPAHRCGRRLVRRRLAVDGTRPAAATCRSRPWRRW